MDVDLSEQRLPFWSGTPAKRLAALRSAVPIFAPAGDAELVRAVNGAWPREVRDRQVITRQNDRDDSFFVIIEGKVQVSAEPLDGGAVHDLGLLEAGGFFGETSLIEDRRRAATATAHSPARLLELPRETMLELLDAVPEIRERIDHLGLIRVLRTHVFPDLMTRISHERLWQLADETRLEKVDAGQVIFDEDEAGDAFYFIRYGMVKLCCATDDGGTVLTYLAPGNFFGEGALYDEHPRTATAAAVQATGLVALDKAVFHGFLAANPHLLKGLVESRERHALETLMEEAMPGASELLSQLIETEPVIAGDVLLIDQHKCIRCGDCVKACEDVHDDGQARLSLTGTRIAQLLLPNSCTQCADPLCMLDCPPDALVRHPGGELFVKDDCIGCGHCVAACPYDNLFMAGGDLAVKCDLCRGIAGGPACIRACPTGAVVRLAPKNAGDLQEQLAALAESGVRT